MTYNNYSGVIFCTDREALHRVMTHVMMPDLEDGEIVHHPVKHGCYSLSYYERNFAPLAFGDLDSSTIKDSKYIEYILAGLAWRWDVHDNKLGRYLKTTSYAWDHLQWNGDPFNTKMALAVIRNHDAY